MRIFGIIDMSLEKLDEEFNKPVVNLEYGTVYSSTDSNDIVAKLKEINASDDDYSIEEYEEDEEGNFIAGTDYDSPSNFIKRHS